MLIHGVSLHLYDEATNKDRFYRTFIWQDNHLMWHVAYHWGRDGAPRGQTKIENYRTQAGVQMALDKKVNEKISKGYEYLGQGDIEVSDSLFNSDFMTNHAELGVIGNKLHDRVGRTPTKLPSGFSLVIREEDEITDWISA